MISEYPQQLRIGCWCVLMINMSWNKKQQKTTGKSTLMDSTLHWGSFKSPNLIKTARKGLLTGDGVTSGSLLDCPHSLVCQPCHFLFAEGAIEIPGDGNLVDSLVSIKKVTLNSTEYLQPTVWAAATASIRVWLRKSSTEEQCQTEEEMRNTQETYRANKHYKQK